MGLQFEFTTHELLVLCDALRRAIDDISLDLLTTLEGSDEEEELTYLRADMRARLRSFETRGKGK